MASRIVLSVTNDMVIDQRVHRIASTLANAGNDVLVIGRYTGVWPDFSDRPYKVHLMRLWFKKGFLFYANYNVSLFFRLLRTNCTILTANDLDSLPANWMAAKLKRVTLFFDSHEYFPEVPEVVNRKWVKRFWTFIEKTLVPRANYHYTVCQSIADLYKSKYNLDFKVVRNVPLLKNEENREVEIERNENIIMYQGAINVGRGIENIIDAMPMIPDAKLVIAGGGPLGNDIKKRIQESPAHERIKYLGRLPFHQLHQYTIQAQIGISIEENLGLNYYYALPNKLFDYIQAGLAVVTSDFPEMKRVVDEYHIGTTIDNRSPENLANTINPILADKKQLSAWQNNARAAAVELCWEKEQNILLSIYKAVNA
ncbi:MAG TPA: glycosyltransferase [Bacteroidales bacterium]